MLRLVHPPSLIPPGPQELRVLVALHRKDDLEVGGVLSKPIGTHGGDVGAGRLTRHYREKIEAGSDGGLEIRRYRSAKRVGLRRGMRRGMGAIGDADGPDRSVDHHQVGRNLDYPGDESLLRRGQISQRIETAIATHRQSGRTRLVGQPAGHLDETLKGRLLQLAALERVSAQEALPCCGHDLLGDDVGQDEKDTDVPVCVVEGSDRVVGEHPEEGRHVQCAEFGLSQVIPGREWVSLPTWAGPVRARKKGLTCQRVYCGIERAPSILSI